MFIGFTYILIYKTNFGGINNTTLLSLIPLNLTKEIFMILFLSQYWEPEMEERTTFFLRNSTVHNFYCVT